MGAPFDAARAISRQAVPIRGKPDDFDVLLNRIGDARFVLLGEATHGTHEFYTARARITRRLITEKGFGALAVEADWPDAYRVNRYVRQLGGDRSSVAALGDFERFPRWMWRNEEVVALVDWLRTHNQSLEPAARVGFYGLDLYSLHRSMEGVVAYLDRVDPRAAAKARERYGCLDEFGDDPARYGYFQSLGLDESCERQVIAQLADLQQASWRYLERDGLAAEDELFCAEQNARLAQNAERYYREMYLGSVRSWNLRDRHMADTLDALSGHLRPRDRSKIVVWEHNSHLGDARATSMGDRGELNVGQLVREKYGSDAVLVGLSTYAGTVAAASEWGGSVELKRVRRARGDSVEGLLHEVGTPALYVDTEVLRPLEEPLRQRAIGVIYHPESELVSHYFHARVSDQFDVMMHFDESRAVTPLERSPQWSRGDLPETFPTGV
jgi:erythromycin esterase-like protein